MAYADHFHEQYKDQLTSSAHCMHTISPPDIQFCERHPWDCIAAIVDFEAFIEK